MIEYRTEGSAWLTSQVCMLNGSVLPTAVSLALPVACFTVLVHWLIRHYAYVADGNGDGIIDVVQMDGVPLIWTGYTSILGFLIVFRNNQAYSRFWEGATLVRQVRGEWFNAISALIAFSSHHPKDEEMRRKQDEFKQLLVRLGSVLYCSALRQICDLDEDTLQVLDLSTIDPESLELLENAVDRCQLIILWLQRAMVKAEGEGVLKVAPPILSRAFQELSRGTVNLSNLRKLKDVPFPFPYQQMLVVMLIIHNFVTALLASTAIDSIAWAGLMSASVVGVFWAIIYIAVEIDQPFGDDANDLPLVEMQQEFNADLVALLNNSWHPLPFLVEEVSDGEDDAEKSFRKPIKHQSVTNFRFKSTEEAPIQVSEKLQEVSVRCESKDSWRGWKSSEEQEEEKLKESNDSPPLTSSTSHSISSIQSATKRLQQSLDTGETSTRSRTARFFREFADIIEEEFDVIMPEASFSRNISDGPPSPTGTGPGGSEGAPMRARVPLRKSISSHHLGGSTQLQAKRSPLCSDQPKDLAAVFRQARAARAALAEREQAGKGEQGDVYAGGSPRVPPSSIPTLMNDMLEVRSQHSGTML